MLLIVLLVLLAIAILPTWPYAAAWGLGYWPSGLLMLLLLAVILFAAMGGSRRAPRL
jgi:hypothetical protein